MRKESRHRTKDHLFHSKMLTLEEQVGEKRSQSRRSRQNILKDSRKSTTFKASSKNSKLTMSKSSYAMSWAV